MKFNLDKYNDFVYCNTFFSKLSGLMFSSKRKLVLVLNNESRLNSIIHTFFVFFNIDIYWLDEKKNIVDFRLNVKPFTVKIPRCKAKYIVEIPTF